MRVLLVPLVILQLRLCHDMDLDPLLPTMELKLLGVLPLFLRAKMLGMLRI